MIEFKVEAMSCGHCASVIAQTLQRVDPQAKVDVDLTAKTVRVESGADRALLSQALSEAGYAPA